ncbi:MAG: hypothetical protein MJ200_04885 [Mycoplasmoidaceae bacterium]|nr:hypothetical protein [Mycoplasmoidaceae bacterium]
MKKTKLLMPVLGCTALVGAVTPLVACNFKPREEKAPEVSVLNLSDTTYNIQISSEGQPKIGKSLDLKLT